MGSSLEDVQFLSRSAHRVAVLEELSEAPRERDELRVATGASAPTIGRVLGDFEERGWTRRDGHAYVLTDPGAFVAEHFSALLERMSTERRLRDVWPLLPGQLGGFTLDLVSDAVVTTIRPGDPYAPANRCASFYPASDRVRGFDAALTAPHTFDQLAELVLGGLELEFVLSPELSRNLQAAYPEADHAVTKSDNNTTWWHYDLPICRAGRLRRLGRPRTARVGRIDVRAVSPRGEARLRGAAHHVSGRSDAGTSVPWTRWQRPDAPIVTGIREDCVGRPRQDAATGSPAFTV